MFHICYLCHTNYISVAILTLNSFLPKGHCTEVFFPSMLLIPLFRKETTQSDCQENPDPPRKNVGK